MKTRTLTVGVGAAHVRKAWGKSSVVIESNNRRAVIEITDPYDLKYLRMQLDEIEEYWKSRLADLST